MEVKLGGKDFGRLETINVSANGVYFTSPSYIAPLTRLEIVLVLPDTIGKRSGTKREVVCEGIVVRTEPEAPPHNHAHYDIACFFTAISETDRAHLESYILSQLTF